MKALTGDGVAASGAKGQEKEELQSPARVVAEERGHRHTEAVALGRGSQALPRGPCQEEAVGAQHRPTPSLLVPDIAQPT